MQAVPMIMMAGSALAKGIGGMASANANAKALQGEARDTLNSGVAEEARIREAARRAMGEQAGALWANGLDGATGSALDALQESRINAALDSLQIRRQARQRADSLQVQARQQKRQGRFALLEGFFGAGSAAYQVSQDWADARRGQSPMPAAVGSGAGSGGGSVGGYSVATPYGRTSAGING